MVYASPYYMYVNVCYECHNYLWVTSIIMSPLSTTLSGLGWTTFSGFGWATLSGERWTFPSMWLFCSWRFEWALFNHRWMWLCKVGRMKWYFLDYRWMFLCWNSSWRVLWSMLWIGVLLLRMSGLHCWFGSRMYLRTSWFHWRSGSGVYFTRWGGTASWCSALLRLRTNDRRWSWKDAFSSSQYACFRSFNSLHAYSPGRTAYCTATSLSVGARNERPRYYSYKRDSSHHFRSQLARRWSRFVAIERAKVYNNCKL